MYIGKVLFQSPLSGQSITCSNADFTTFVSAESPTEFKELVQGQIIFNDALQKWVVTGFDKDSNTVLHGVQKTTEEMEAAGFTFSQSEAEGDIVPYTYDYYAEISGYVWERIDVQP